VTLLFLSKLVPLFVYPVGLTLVLGLAAVGFTALGFRRVARTLSGLAIAVLWLASTPLLANWLQSRLEAEYPPVAVDASPHADVAIVLGGAVGQAVPPRITPDVSDAFDRVLHTARLYRAGLVGVVLVSGGNLPWQASAKPEAELIADLLVDLAVPRSAIVLDVLSQNTHENAINSAAIMTARGWKDALLVTSAAHMPRAFAAFRREGVAVSPAVTDIQVTYPLFQSLLDLMPDADALARTTNVLKEYVGLIAYRLAGWA
jgi:uncharacterized SAM-binding protein YcdF (DUF218 family)